ncbi:MAG: hypothetical protein AAGC60_30320 [Acidobacteriota bacterium]
MNARTAFALRTVSRGAKEAAQRLAPDPQVVIPREHFAQVHVVEADVLLRDQLQNPVLHLVWRSIRRGAAAIAMDEGLRALRLESPQESPCVARAQPESNGGFIHETRSLRTAERIFTRRCAFVSNMTISDMRT